MGLISTSGVRLGVFGTTLFLTPQGMVAARHLRPGVWLTGIAPATRVIGVHQAYVPRDLGTGDWPILLHRGVAGEALLLPPDQPVLIPWQEEALLVPVCALEGWGVVTRAVPTPGVPVVRICLEQPGFVPDGRGVVFALPDASGLYPAPFLAMGPARALVAKQVAVEAGKGLALALSRQQPQAALRAPPPKRA